MPVSILSELLPKPTRGSPFLVTMPIFGGLMSIVGLMFCFISRTADIKRFFCFTGIFLLSGLALPASAPEAKFANDPEAEIALPYFTLAWSLSEAAAPGETLLFEIEQAESADFADAETYYKGPDLASFVSGLGEGTYFFRIRSFDPEKEPGKWSDQIQVKVEYESLTQALVLFTIGGIVSVATIAMVIIGDQKTRREEAKIT